MPADRDAGSVVTPRKAGITGVNALIGLPTAGDHRPGASALLLMAYAHCYLTVRHIAERIMAFVGEFGGKLLYYFGCTAPMPRSAPGIIAVATGFGVDSGVAGLFERRIRQSAPGSNGLHRAQQDVNRCCGERAFAPARIFLALTI